MDEQKAKVRLETLLLEGLHSGQTTPMTEQDWEEIRQELRKRATRRDPQERAS